MKSLKMAAAILLAAAIIIGLTACGSDKRQVNGPAEELESENGGIVSSQRIEYSGSDMTPAWTASNGELVYFCARDYKAVMHIFSFDVQSNEISDTGYSTPNMIIAMGVSPGGRLFAMEFEERGDSEDMADILVEIGGDGKALSELDLSPLVDRDGTMVRNILPTDDGVIVGMHNSVVLVDGQGQELSRLDIRGSDKRLVWGAEGQILLCGPGQEGYEVTELSPDLKDKTTYVLDNIYSFAYDGWYSKGVILKDNSKVYSVDYRENSREILVDMLKSGMRGGFTCVGENTFMTFEDGTPTLWTPGEAGGETVTLTMASHNIDPELYRQITEFNRTNSRYKIEVNDYSSYDINTDTGAGIKILNTELISGKVPDIFDLSELPFEIYKSKGLLEDLTPYVQNEKLVESVVKVLSEDGKMYSFVPAFDITMAFGNANSVGSREDWTTEKFLSVAESFEGENVFSPTVTRDQFIKYLLIFSVKDGSSTAGSYKFNNSDFIRLLEFAATLPESTDALWSTYELLKLKDGSQLLDIRTTGMPAWDIRDFNGVFDGNSSPVGFPSAKGGRYALSTCMWLGMVSTGEYKEGVWEFFSFLLRDEFQSEVWRGHDIPAREDILTEAIDREINEGAGKTFRTSIFDENSNETFLESRTYDGLRDDVWDVINHMDCLSEYNEFVYSIVTDEASAYFDGTVTAEEAADRIQSRVDIYMSEQE